MPKCFYCGKEYDFPRGLSLVKNDGTVRYLCSSKCRKNMLMNRRKVNWIRKSDEAKAENKK
ncbi:50S ribosomal protein L24e [uncultured archaeon]|nr:50S ribosomal protein L24e [uncultured archaeon]